MFTVSYNSNRIGVAIELISCTMRDPLTSREVQRYNYVNRQAQPVNCIVAGTCYELPCCSACADVCHVKKDPN
jgi:hypothetical protein